MDASEIYSKRLNAKEVIFPKQGEFIFPIADGRIKPSGGDQELRTSTLVRHRPSSLSSPTVGEIPVREKDAPNSDISPVQVSNSVDDGSGQPDEIQANKNPKPNKKETTIER